MYAWNDGAYLAHHGIKGQKWGVRRFQNEDGSYTSAGRARYGMTKDKLKSIKADYKNANREYSKAWDYASSKTGLHLTKKGKQAQDEAWDKAYDLGQVARKKQLKYNDAKKKYRDAEANYKRDINDKAAELRKNASFADKLLGYTDAVYKKQAKMLIDSNGALTASQVKKKVTREAWRNTAIALAAIGIASSISVTDGNGNKLPISEWF